MSLQAKSSEPPHDMLPGKRKTPSTQCILLEPYDSHKRMSQIEAAPCILNIHEVVMKRPEMIPTKLNNLKITRKGVVETKRIVGSSEPPSPEKANVSSQQQYEQEQPKKQNSDTRRRVTPPAVFRAAATANVPSNKNEKLISFDTVLNSATGSKPVGSTIQGKTINSSFATVIAMPSSNATGSKQNIDDRSHSMSSMSSTHLHNLICCHAPVYMSCATDIERESVVSKVLVEIFRQGSFLASQCNMARKTVRRALDSAAMSLMAQRQYSSMLQSTALSTTSVSRLQKIQKMTNDSVIFQGTGAVEPLATSKWEGENTDSVVEGGEDNRNYVNMSRTMNVCQSTFAGSPAAAPCFTLLNRAMPLVDYESSSNSFVYDQSPSRATAALDLLSEVAAVADATAK